MKGNQSKTSMQKHGETPTHGLLSLLSHTAQGPPAVGATPPTGGWTLQYQSLIKELDRLAYRPTLGRNFLS